MDASYLKMSPAMVAPPERTFASTFDSTGPQLNEPY